MSSYVDQFDDKVQNWHQNIADEAWVRYGITRVHFILVCIFFDDFVMYLNQKPDEITAWPYFVVLDCVCGYLIYTKYDHIPNKYLLFFRKLTVTIYMKAMMFGLFISGFTYVFNQAWWSLQLMANWLSCISLMYFYLSTFDLDGLTKRRDERAMDKATGLALE